MYEESRQRSLFEKFDRIVIEETKAGSKNKINIAGDDVKHCETVQHEFDLIMENLRYFKNLCAKIKQEADQSGKYDSFKNMSKTLLYFPGADFDEKEQEAKVSLIYHINRYFSEKYNLKDMDCTDLLSLENLNYNHILDKIFSEYGDIVKGGVDTLVKDFRHHFVRLPAYEPKPPKISRNRISMFKRYWFNTNYDHTEFYFENNNEAYRVFCRALLYFETGDITSDKTANFPKRGYKSRIDFTKSYELGLSKIAGVKFYKNGRIDLIFLSNEEARSFFEMFDLSNPYDYSRR